METGELPRDVLQFIADQIDTVPHLEALLLLFEQPSEQWTVDHLAARLYVSKETAGQILQDLQQRRLVKEKPESTVLAYAYDQGWDGTGQLMASVAMTYRRKLTPVAAFIHSKAARSVLEFARAFDLKKDR
ncbi:MAG: MarR family transcriptional regulator [Steroidobacteraceae bacterium]